MIDLKSYGYIEDKTPLPGLIPGRVVEVQRDQYKVITVNGEITAYLKGKYYHSTEMRGDLPYVGDYVFVEYHENGYSLIVELLPRRSKFSRADNLGRGRSSNEQAGAIVEQVVATNFDYVFIITSLNRDFRINRIVRYLTQAWQSGGQPVVILTKADLVDNFNTQVNDVIEAAPGVPVHAISSHTGVGLEALNEYLQPGKTVVFLGMSGVGKSSLLNMLAGKEIMKVNETRKEDDSKGRHTTTHRQLFMLHSGAMIIDTPGMRELGLFNAEEGLSVGFSDLESLFTQCRFSNCSHMTEPGCAVRASLANGSLSKEHWERYLSLIKEVRITNDKEGYLAEKNEFFKSGKIQQRKFEKSIRKGKSKK